MVLTLMEEIKYLVLLATGNAAMHEICPCRHPHGVGTKGSSYCKTGTNPFLSKQVGDLTSVDPTDGQPALPFYH